MVLNSADFDEKQLEDKMGSIAQVDKSMLMQSTDGIAENESENQSVSMIVHEKLLKIWEIISILYLLRMDQT